MKPYYTEDGVTIWHGDCVEIMAAMDAGSVDAVVCDPPYGLEFMGKDWDSFGADTGNGYSEKPRWTGDHMGKGFDQLPNHYEAGRPYQAWCRAWAGEALRVLKPGGHLLAFGGTRTYHRLACAIEDAGFEIRDSLHWLYGSGFPKSLDVSKAIDKASGAERTERVGPKPGHENFVGRDNMRALREGTMAQDGGFSRPWMHDPEQVEAAHWDMAPATPEAQQWDGWGTALKPAHEPIVLARKPPVSTVAANVLRYGTGALNIDGCRVEFASEADETESKEKNRHADFGTEPGGNNVYGDFSMVERVNYAATGRWPPNVVLSHDEGCVQVGTVEVRANGHYPAARGPSGDFSGDTGGLDGQEGLAERVVRAETVETWACVEGCPVAELDRQSGVTTSIGGKGSASGLIDNESIYGRFSGDNPGATAGGFGDTGGASRFFPVFRYEPKVARQERNEGVRGDAKPLLWSSGTQNPGSFQSANTNRASVNNHPTVKPVALMRWLIRLVTPPRGVVLDPFLGSGSTAIAAWQEDHPCIGIERDESYVQIAVARVRAAGIRGIQQGFDFDAAPATTDAPVAEGLL
ncbi:MAG: site-specific DNA-methyltransferase [Pseudomonadota bacterium]